MNRQRRFLLLIVAGLLQACASFDSGGVRDLTAAEIEVLSDTQARLAANQAAVRGALDDLADNTEFALRQQHRLSTSIAKAQLLEAMQSPWSNAELTATQREVAMYHLFVLSEAEQKVIAARVESRRARIAKLKTSYGRLISGMSALIGAQEQMLVHLDQPAGTQISLVVQQVVAESGAFRESLDTSNNPGLQRLSETVADREKDVVAAEAKIAALLKAIEEE